MSRLQRIARSEAGGLAVIWGRRRVGKTRLLLEWASKHDGLYTVADQSSPEVQRRYLAEALGTRFEGFQDAAYHDWDALLRRAAREAKGEGWRGPLILDEFPYLANASPELPSVLQRWLETEAAAARLTVALAGSSQRMMQGLVLGPEAPLYGRASQAMQLEPLMAGYTGEALSLRDPVDCLRAFAVWGGVPRYWELAADVPGSLEAAVDGCVLDPLAPLHREPDRLLQEELPPAVSLRPLLDVIGMGAHRLSEIAGRVGQPVTSLSRPMARLRDLGLVDRQRPFGHSEKGGKRTLYRIADPFFRMWFRVVAPSRALLAQAPRRTRIDLWRKARTALFAEAWEDLCRASVPRLTAAGSTLAAGGTWGPAARYWSGGGPEWDVVALSTDGRRVLLGEVKWSERAVSAPALAGISRELRSKGIPPVAGRDVEVVRAVFVPRAAKGAEVPGNLHLVDADCVLHALRQETYG